jgi:integrase/recombinase XerD
MWNELLQKFEDHMCVRHFASRTIEDYIRNTRSFIAYLAGRGITKISEVERDDIKEYLTFLFYFRRGNKGLSPGTRMNKIAAVKSFFGFLVTENYLLYDPAGDIELPKTSKRLPRDILSHKEMLKLLSAPSRETPIGIRDRAMLELFYSTGMRNTELRCLKLGDMDMRRNEVRICFGKGGKSRIVPIGEAAIHYLSLYLENGRPQLASRGKHSELLFLNVRGGPLSRRSLPDMVKKYAKKAKIQKKIGCHTLRHTCATHMLKGKADLRCIQELLGHSSLTATQIYTKVELSDLKEVHKRCHPRNLQ